MAITPLSFGLTIVPSTTLATANALTTNNGATTSTTIITTVNSATGFGEIPSNGTTAAWPGGLVLGEPDGRGWVLDGALLEQQQIPAGVWSGSLPVAITQLLSLVADLYVRVGIYHSATATVDILGALLIPQQTITTSFGTVNFSGALPSFNFGVGDRLYLDIWANVTSNPNSSGSVGIDIGNIATSLVISASAWTTPGYQPQTLDMRSRWYTYGGFPLNDNVNYFLLSKSFDTVDVKETLFKVARFEGMKKTGEVVNERTMQAQVRVLGSSRADLEAKLDALYQALDQRQQQLVLHSVDGRYYVADAITAKAPLGPGRILSTTVPVSFICQQPYAFAAQQSSFASGSVLLTPVSGQTGVWQSALYAFPGGGNKFSRPTLTIQNQTPINNTTLSSTGGLTNGTPYTSLSVAALPAAANVGDTFTLGSGGNFQNVVVSAAAAQGATSLSVQSFTANFSYPASTTTVRRQGALTQIVVTQLTDGQTLTVPNISVGINSRLYITCDPTAANGFTVVQDNGAPIGFSGVFPVLEPGITQWLIQMSCLSDPLVAVTWTWTPRWLA